METIEPILAAHPFFQGLSSEHIKEIAQCGARVSYNAGQFLCRTDAEAMTFFLIYQGRVAVEIFSARRGPVVIQTLNHGDVLGWLWFDKPYHWHLDARALDLTRAIALDVKCLMQRCEANRDLGYELMKRYAHSLAVSFRISKLQMMDMYQS
jgi:CRP-like cAMP-binding protein